MQIKNHLNPCRSKVHLPVLRSSVVNLCEGYQEGDGRRCSKGDMVRSLVTNNCGTGDISPNMHNKENIHTNSNTNNLQQQPQNSTKMVDPPIADSECRIAYQAIQESMRKFGEADQGNDNHNDNYIGHGDGDGGRQDANETEVVQVIDCVDNQIGNANIINPNLNNQQSVPQPYPSDLPTPTFQAAYNPNPATPILALIQTQAEAQGQTQPEVQAQMHPQTQTQPISPPNQSQHRILPVAACPQIRKIRGVGGKVILGIGGGLGATSKNEAANPVTYKKKRETKNEENVNNINHGIINNNVCTIITGAQITSKNPIKSSYIKNSIIMNTHPNPSSPNPPKNTKNQANQPLVNKTGHQKQASPITVTQYNLGVDAETDPQAKNQIVHPPITNCMLDQKFTQSQKQNRRQQEQGQGLVREKENFDRNRQQKDRSQEGRMRMGNRVRDCNRKKNHSCFHKPKQIQTQAHRKQQEYIQSAQHHQGERQKSNQNEGVLLSSHKKSQDNPKKLFQSCEKQQNHYNKLLQNITNTYIKNNQNTSLMQMLQHKNSVKTIIGIADPQNSCHNQQNLLGSPINKKFNYHISPTHNACFPRTVTKNSYTQNPLFSPQLEKELQENLQLTEQLESLEKVFNQKKMEYEELQQKYIRLLEVTNQRSEGHIRILSQSRLNKSSVRSQRERSRDNSKNFGQILSNMNSIMSSKCSRNHQRYRSILQNSDISEKVSKIKKGLYALDLQSLCDRQAGAKTTRSEIATGYRNPVQTKDKQNNKEKTNEDVYTGQTKINTEKIEEKEDEINFKLSQII